MAYLGRKGASAPLTSADIPDSSITTAKIVDGTVAEGDLAFSTATQAELDAQRTNSSITTLGTVTAGDISHADIVYPSGHIIKTQHTFLPTENYVSNAGTSYVNYWSPTYTPLKNNSIVYAWLHLMGSSSHNGNWQPVWTHKYSISGANITNLTDCEGTQRGWSNETTTNKQTWMEIQHMNLLNPVTLDGTGTGTITYALSFKNNNSNWYSHALRINGWTSGTDSKGSSILFQEVAP